MRLDLGILTVLDVSFFLFSMVLTVLDVSLIALSILLFKDFDLKE